MYIVYNVHCTMYTVHCTVYIVQCILYSVHCTVYMARLESPGPTASSSCDIRIQNVRFPLITDILKTSFYKMTCHRNLLRRNAFIILYDIVHIDIITSLGHLYIGVCIYIGVYIRPHLISTVSSQY